MSTSKPPRALILHAANVHCGGGLALLKELAVNRSISFNWVHLDVRAKGILEFPLDVIKYHVKPSILSRFLAEWRLWRNVTINDIVLCFNGLPPLFHLSGQAVVFVQNRILVEQGSLFEYPIKTKLRLLVERFWLRSLQRHATRYVVQTQSMAAALKSIMGEDVEICVFPFANIDSLFLTGNAPNVESKFCFAYVASGEAHKNHAMLLEAWRLLAESSLYPSLALTIDQSQHPLIHAEILRVASEYSLNIVNLGQLTAEGVAELYRCSTALIYPSKTESFGLPLVEAAQYKLPILASELDYVRDVVVPIETFDPNSPVSISRAVRRFLGDAELTVHIHSPEEFLANVLK